MNTGVLRRVGQLTDAEAGALRSCWHGLALAEGGRVWARLNEWRGGRGEAGT